jgi:hypothetical protein
VSVVFAFQTEHLDPCFYPLKDSPEIDRNCLRTSWAHDQMIKFIWLYFGSIIIYPSLSIYESNETCDTTTQCHDRDPENHIDKDAEKESGQ